MGPPCFCKTTTYCAHIEQNSLAKWLSAKTCCNAHACGHTICGANSNHSNNNILIIVITVIRIFTNSNIKNNSDQKNNGNSNNNVKNSGLQTGWLEQSKYHGACQG